MKSRRAITTLCVLVLLSTPLAADDILRESFDSYSDGKDATQLKNWEGFRGFPGKQAPTAAVKEKAGYKGSSALAVWHSEPFRTDGWGLHVKLAKPLSTGVVWLQCRMQPPKDWTGGFFFDARSSRNILTRVACTEYRPQKKAADLKPQLRWHASWHHSYWRLYTKTALNTKAWYTVTLRIDLDGKRYVAWVDEQPLGEELPLCAKGPITHLFLGIGGTKDSPGLIDDLVVSRTAPEGIQVPQLLPEPKKDLVFRFAAFGDPQLGFGGYEADKVRFAFAVDQVNRAKPDLSVILGDMVHANDNEAAYRDLEQLAKALKAPHYYIRGNHDRIEYFQKHFYPKLDYSFVHKGLRFVVIDAIGNHAGLSSERLAWIEAEFQKAEKSSEEIVICLHVSPWQNNDKGRGKYNQIGPGRDKLRALMQKHKVLLSLSGHYHRGLWHAKEEETHYLVLGGTARVSGGYMGWCVFDVYPDRVEMHQKPLFFAYEKAGAKRFHEMMGWHDYVSVQKRYPYLQRGPLVIKRHRPVERR